MEIISNGFLGKKYCNFCDTVVKLNQEDIKKPNLCPDHMSYWICPICGLNNRLVVIKEKNDD